MMSKNVVMAVVAVAILGGCASTPHSSGTSDAGGATVDPRVAAQHMYAGRVDEASKSVKHIVNPRLLLGMRVDKRYAALVESMPTHFDIERATNASFAVERAAIEAQPRSLRARVAYAASLLESMKYQDAFDVTTTAIETILSAEKRRAGFDDTSDHFAWLLDQRAWALWGLSRWDEAVEMMSTAAKTKESGSENVSQAINLALMTAKLGRIPQAQDALTQLGPYPSRYGKTQVALVKLIMAEQTKDKAKSEEAFSYLQQNQNDSLNTYQIALLETNRLEEAEAFYISRLQNPATRFEALLEAQDYADYYTLFSKGPERVRLRLERWQSLLRRDSVQKEIARVGKVERSKLRSPM